MKPVRYLAIAMVIIGLFSAYTLAIPAFCNRIEAGSTIDTSVINIRTSASDRFVMLSGANPVELEYQIRVQELLPDIPSSGFVSAYMDAVIQEGNGESGSAVLMERVRVHDSSTVDGDITLFEKIMHYQSGLII